MAIEFKNPADAVMAQGIKMLIFGAAGSGKTVMCATAKEPTLIISTEGGLLSIKDAPNTIQIVECNTSADVAEILTYLESNKRPPWICVDSISEIGEVVLKEERAKSPGDQRKPYGELAQIMEVFIKRFRDLPDTHVVMTAKLDSVQDGASNAMLYGPGMPGQKTGKALPYMFDLVGALQVHKDNEGKLIRTLQTNRDGQWDAKDRSGKLDIYELPNLAHIKSKILGTTAKRKAA
tara:strand:- start:685 stop:1389 length:705 start_codon:yes stop_codon:yes gene_type:complete